MTKFAKNPQALAFALRQILAAGMAFGLKLTAEQMFALMAAVEAVMQLFLVPKHEAERAENQALKAEVSRLNGSGDAH